MSNFKITILGSGTSQGVPVIACDCDVCMSLDPKDKRLRSSIFVENDSFNFVIDTGPDFRQQMLASKVQSLDAVLFTHEHKDHIAGLDDIRAFNFKFDKSMDVYCNAAVKEALYREFHYVFSENKYPGTPSVNLNVIENKKFRLKSGLEILPIQVLHYKMPVFGFRIHNFAYVTDAKTIESTEIEKLYQLDVLIINCLQILPHISHFNLEEVLDFISVIAPKKTYLTHISHNFDKHETILKMLPSNVSVCFDGQVIEL
jgi:phosphoribosyl 1,2-cyclic phosphate phosphodiesterase